MDPNWATSLPDGLAKSCVEPRGPRHANNMTSLSCKGPALDACHTPPTRDRKQIHCKLDPRGTRVDPPSKWTRKDSRGQAWTRQYRPVDPQDFLLDTRLKTRPVQDCFYLGPIMLPRSKWSTAPPKQAFAGASFGGSRSMVKPASPGRSSTVAELLCLKLTYCWR